jgi:FAD/FMN-containing dehydrogenase
MPRDKILTPVTREELVEILRTNREPVRVRGTAAKAETGDIVMNSLNRLVLYEPGEMIVQVEAGMTLEELDRTLARENQWIPTLQPDEDLCTTIGGSLSLDTYHPRARNTMTLRTTVLGGTFCTAQGGLFRSGSRVVKSVAGYDSHRAFAGARGAFGVIVEVTLRVLPRPESIVRFRAPRDMASQLQSERPSVLEVVGDQFLVEFSGYREDVEDTLGRFKGIDLNSIDNSEWSAAIRDIRSRHTTLPASGKELELMMRLKQALDPEGVLRDE